MSIRIDSLTISKITEKEKEITGETGPVKGGPTAMAQKHAGESLNDSVISDITNGEKKINDGDLVADGPTAVVQSMLTTVCICSPMSVNLLTLPIQGGTSNENTNGAPHTGVLDSDTISKVTEAEKKLSGSEEPARGGPTARAQQHAGETINSKTLHDVTEGEKMVTDGERVKGGPTSILQSELAKSRQ